MKLHIANGDSTGEMLKEISEIEGDILCWRDVLHDGPLLNASYNEYAAARAKFLATTVNTTLINQKQPINESDILQEFIDRKATLERLEQYDEVILWFEHDLYDQLQIVEIMAELNSRAESRAKLSIICIGEHPEVPYFHGLGQLTLKQLLALYPSRVGITQTQLDIGAKIWSALRSSSPGELLNSLEDSRIQGFPYMKAALMRFFREFPALGNGLTLTQWHLLNAIAKPCQALPALMKCLEQNEAAGRLNDGVRADDRYQEIVTGEATFSRLFHQIQQLETAPFMGDLWVKKELNALSQARVPYVACSFVDQEHPVGINTQYEITDAGRQALKGELHWGDVNGYDLWRGGVYITGKSLMFWDEKTLTFTSQRHTANRL